MFLLRQQKNFKTIVFNLMMMFLAWTAMSFGINLLTFYTKYLPGEVYNNSMVIGFAALIFVLAGPLSKKLKVRHILSASYLLAFIGSLIMFAIIS